jgi:hypothetical protein
MVSALAVQRNHDPNIILESVKTRQDAINYLQSGTIAP